MKAIEPIIGAMLLGNDFKDTGLLQGKFKDLVKMCKDQVLRLGKPDFGKIYQAFKGSISPVYILTCVDRYSADKDRQKRDSIDFGRPYCKYPREDNIDRLDPVLVLIANGQYAEAKKLKNSS